MELENILYSKSDGVVTIALNRPKAFNSVDPGLGSDLVRALETVNDDPEARAVIITGTGKFFCTGGDITYFKTFFDTDPSEPFRQIIKNVNMAVMLIRRMPKPVIAMVNGVTGGGGFSIAAACDFRICGNSTKFRSAYASINMPGDGGWSIFVPLLIGFGRTMELMMLDPVLDAQQALQWGLVTKMVNDEDLEKEARAMAARLASGPTKAFAIAKENMNRSMLAILESQLELERSGMIAASRYADYTEGVHAFFEKRKPHFQGK